MVVEAAVFALPDPVMGESVAAAVVPQQAGRRLEPRDLIAWCAGRLAHYKVPSQLFMVTQLPKSG